MAIEPFSLARFPEIERDSARQYVMMFALHAGMPVHSVAQLLSAINEHIAGYGRSTPTLRSVPGIS